MLERVTLWLSGLGDPLGALVEDYAVTTQDIDARLGKLEKQNRRLRTLALLGALLVGAGVLMAQKRVPTSVEARGFVVRDAAGRPRALLGSEGLSLFDRNGELRVALLLAAGEDRDVASLGFYDARGDLRAHFEVAPDEVSLAANHPDGRTAWELCDSKDGPTLSLRDGNGTPRVVCTVLRAGPACTLLDADRSVRALVQVAGNRAGINLYDANGTSRIAIATTGDLAGVVLNDAAHKLMWCTPMESK